MRWIIILMIPWSINEMQKVVRSFKTGRTFSKLGVKR